MFIKTHNCPPVCVTANHLHPVYHYVHRECTAVNLVLLESKIFVLSLLLRGIKMEIFKTSLLKLVCYVMQYLSIFVVIQMIQHSGNV